MDLFHPSVLRSVCGATEVQEPPPHSEGDEGGGGFKKKKKRERKKLRCGCLLGGELMFPDYSKQLI